MLEKLTVRLSVVKSIAVKLLVLVAGRIGPEIDATE